MVFDVRYNLGITTKAKLALDIIICQIRTQGKKGSRGALVIVILIEIATTIIIIVIIII